MALYQRNGVYYVKITRPDGTSTRHSTGTRDRREAEEYHDRLKANLWEQSRLGLKPSRTWDEAALKWLQEKRGSKRTFSEDVRYIKWWTPFLRGKFLDEITRDLVDDIITKHHGNDSPRTKDAYMAIIRGIFRMAMREWRWIDTMPAFRSYQTNRDKRGRIRWLTPQQVETLFAELPRHTRLVVLFSLMTGLRMGNVLGLRWTNVDLERRVAYVDQTKNDDPLTVPLSETAIKVLKAVQGEHEVFVFTYRGKPIKRTNTRAWRNALKRAGIEDFRWHDLRHTWASWLRQHGVPTWALKDLAGWRSAAMAERYAHITVSHLAPFVDTLDTLLDTPDFLEEAVNEANSLI